MMQQLSGFDATFVSIENPRTPNHVALYFIYDPTTARGGSVSCDDVVANLARRVHLVALLRLKLARVPLDLDVPYWVEDPDFDFDYHVRHLVLPEPGTWSQFTTLLGRLHARPLDMSRPLWECYVIEGLNDVEDLSKGAFVLLFKIHHAAIDGQAGVELMNVLHDLSPDAPPPPPAPPWDPPRGPSSAKLLGRGALNLIRSPVRVAAAVGRVVPGFGRALAAVRSGSLQRPPRGAPPTRFNAPVSARRVTDACRVSLTDLKRIKGIVPGATVNDAVLAVFAGALSQYLESKGELPSEPLIAIMPISVRTEDERAAIGNRVATTTVSLATDVEDPVERLRAIHASTSNAKSYVEAVDARALSELSNLMPGALVGIAYRAVGRLAQTGAFDHVRPRATATISNTPGPTVPLYFAGARLVTYAGMGPIYDGGGLIMGPTSYCDDVNFTFTSCPEIVPDREWFVECVRQSFYTLLAAAAPPTGSAAPRRAGTHRARK